jgi:hypothetical protein
VLTLPLEIIELVPREIAGAHELRPQRIAIRTRPGRSAANDKTLIESEEDGFFVAFNDEGSSFPLMSDELKNFGDAEVSKITVECYRHIFDPSPNGYFGE